MFKMITLTPLKEFDAPIMAACINPDLFEVKSITEISELPVYEGNQKKKLDDLFKIDKNSTENSTITIKGDMSKVKRIGMGMERGEIVLNGNGGMHLGEKMSGGKITVNGNANGWTGSSMKGGLIEIHGDASDYLASPYRGTSIGMRGGEIVVDGKVGSDSGCYMKGGVIKIRGGAGPFLGYHMMKGTIYVEKDCKNRTGACMIGGKIIVNAAIEEVLPTFTVDEIKAKVKIDANEKATGPFYVFYGDLAENGKGKLYVSKEANPHLGAFYDKYLD
jgi:formylmethanofuran dehydrogenase subunit C